MPRKTSANLPVKDLNKSVDFFTQLGFEFDPNFTEKDICDSTTQTETMLGLSADSREQVDDLVNKALAAELSRRTTPWTRASCTE